MAPRQCCTRKVDEQGKERITARHRDSAMELAVMLDAVLAAGGMLHRQKMAADFVQVFGCVACGGERGCLGLHRGAQFEDVKNGVFGFGRACGEPEGAAGVFAGDESAGSLACFDQALGLQAGEGFADDGAADPVGTGERIGAGKPVARR